MVRKSWDETWMTVAHAVGERSRCSRRQIGAVVVSSGERVVSTGYNGAPAGFPSAAEATCIHYCPRARGASEASQGYDNCVSVHAEANALIYADRHLYEGGTLYVTSSVCMGCGKLVSNSGIKRVVMLHDPIADAHRRPWDVVAFMEKCGLTVKVIEG